MLFQPKKRKIKIIELDGSNISQKYETDSVSDFSSLNKVIGIKIR